MDTGAVVPGAGVPGAGVPGAGVPGAGVPGAGVPGVGAGGVGWLAGGFIGRTPLPAAPMLVGVPVPPDGEPLPIEPGPPALLPTAAEPATLEPVLTVAGELFSGSEPEQPASTRHPSKHTIDWLSRTGSSMVMTHL
ncbi:MAG TPA: hypothetical protein VFG30_41965 [Polyangiales bacterium]|nr:hypothetical protein [Polyangiales bacterium]